MDIIFPAQVRAALYVIVVLATAVIVPLNIGGVVSDLVLAVFTSVSGAVSALAALNVQRKV